MNDGENEQSSAGQVACRPTSMKGATLFVSALKYLNISVTSKARGLTLLIYF